MIDEVMMTFKGNWYLIIMGVAVLTGLIFCKGKRKPFFIPAMILSGAVLNPLMYQFWNKFNTYGYWRLLWILPVVPACAMIPAYIFEKVKTNVVRIAIVCIAAAVFVVGGSIVFSLWNTKFAVATNPDKLPDSVVKVGEALLEMDEQPHVVTDSSLSQYLRSIPERSIPCIPVTLFLKERILLRQRKHMITLLHRKEAWMLLPGT